MTAPALDLAAALEAVAGCPDFRVMRRFIPREHYNDEPWNAGDPPRTRLGVFVDVEATGLDVQADEIIELSLVPFTYDADSGIVYDCKPAISFFEEPKGRISPEITELTGITPEMIRGQRINDALVGDTIGRASLVIAHNADYDRRMCERRLPVFERTPWACSQREVPWKKFGVNGGALGNILMSACGEFTDDAHRAAVDCYVGVHCLAAAQLEERTALSYLLESARAGAHRVCALNSPMEAKELLRGRKYRALYRWGRFQYWYKDVSPAEVEAEVEWCSAEAYADPDVKIISARDRYSVRADQ